MEPIVHIVRHAEGLHNVQFNWDIEDPALTATGLQQAQDLGTRSAGIRSRLTHLVSSPSRRTIDTGMLAFGDAMRERGGKMLLQPDLQEVRNHRCNVPATREVIAERHGPADLDLWYLDARGLYRKREAGRYREDPNAVAERATDVRNWLRDVVKAWGEGAEVVVVTHQEFAPYLTKDPPRVWGQAALHSYRFANWQGDTDNDAEANLVYVSPEVVDALPNRQAPVAVPGASAPPQPEQAVQAVQPMPTPPAETRNTAPTTDPAPGPVRVRPPVAPGPPRPPAPVYHVEVFTHRFSKTLQLRARQILRFRRAYPGEDPLFPAPILAQALAVCHLFSMPEDPNEEVWPENWSPRFRGQRRTVASFMNNWNQCFR